MCSSDLLGFPIAVLYKFLDDQGVYLAALIAYYGFVSLFPLLLLLSTILGFVLSGAIAVDRVQPWGERLRLAETRPDGGAGEGADMGLLAAIGFASTLDFAGTWAATFFLVVALPFAAFIALVAAISWPLGRWLFWTLQPSMENPRLAGV